MLGFLLVGKTEDRAKVVKNSMKRHWLLLPEETIPDIALVSDPVKRIQEKWSKVI